MKRGLILAGCLLLGGLCLLSKVQLIHARQKSILQHACLDCSTQEPANGKCFDDHSGKSVPCAAMPGVVVPTIKEVVTHSMGLSCPEGYESWYLDDAAEKWPQGVVTDGQSYVICVTPAFIAQLKRANEEGK